ncbi:MAG: hypothetical protein COV10_02540 [Candidatus Vogelbacteria bacterium CG10_big_fil_rev_8_21_14_0_10_51_16]|uniref:NYN domain-containing protein n=1 Tax=Candidatus Vogelbacteria bacterium CG10_big_fil_rev_8_21_14_0_10_51_16 TaxID=1975045 RepID=A0A2H0REI3_9BACT|nr:MAG: hypothetical protein COV10_02540 [Candidatus Vogelbacteria bacterium CG10_big_fil_rev_8_21_14_0_10_51_16]
MRGTAGFSYDEKMTILGDLGEKNRVAVFIDGSNLYHRLKELSFHNTVKFEYGGLATFLARKRPLTNASYYVGVVRAKIDDVRGQELRKQQQRLFQVLNNQNLNIRRGYIMSHGDRFYEKGVDVQIAVDLLVGAYEDEYDTAVLLSSDTDLIPAIKKVRNLGKRVEYVGFSHRPSFALQRHADISRLLLPEEIAIFQCNEVLT